MPNEILHHGVRRPRLFKNIFFRTFLGIGLLILVTTVVMSFIAYDHYLTSEFETQKKELLILANQLEIRLREPIRALYSQNKPPNITNSSNVEIASFKKDVQIITKEFNQKYPLYSMGYFDTSLNFFTGIAPDLPLQSLSKDYTAPHFDNYETEKSSLLDFEFGTQNNIILSLTYPISMGGQIGGYLWINVKTNDLYSLAFSKALKFFWLGALILACIIYLAWTLIRKLRKELQKFVDSVIHEDVNIDQSLIPELFPLLLKTKEYTQNLKQYQTELAKTNVFLNNILEGINDVCFALNNEWRFTYLNHQAEQILEKSKDELIGRIIWDLYPPSLYGEIYEPLHHALSEHKTINFEFSSSQLDLWYEFHAYPFTDGILIFIRNITSRKKTEQSIAVLASIVNHSNDGIIGTDIDNTIISWNPAAERIYGYSAEEIIGKKIYCLASPQYQQDQLLHLEKIKAGELIDTYETVRLYKNGRQIDVAVTLSPIRNKDGEIIGLSSITRDITENKRVEREMARLDRLNIAGQMAAGISHEIRNPITTIRGFLQMLSNKKAYSMDKEFFDLMINELDRANSIITEFLTLARTKPLALKRSNLNQLLETIYPMIQADALQADKDVQMELGSIPDFNFDGQEIRQLVLNIVRNGLEATPSQGKVTIQTYEADKKIVLSITDQGSGIPSDILPQLGTPFFTTKENGTGMGLTICYQIADHHQAKIDIATSSEGSTFYVKFPLPFLK